MTPTREGTRLSAQASAMAAAGVAHRQVSSIPEGSHRHSPMLYCLTDPMGCATLLSTHRLIILSATRPDRATFGHMSPSQYEQRPIEQALEVAPMGWGWACRGWCGHGLLVGEWLSYQLVFEPPGRQTKIRRPPRQTRHHPQTARRLDHHHQNT